ncbi:hypothetical protein CRG98_047133 [Punica granatum]|uniref:Uncharacterized protein n=1 Tax=Punica granatum TaxID=22663 RepID=A0A2I0HLD6_PUNGR|nr:hypothetical protein CRG98_047133 [Punica granatum]
MIIFFKENDYTKSTSDIKAHRRSFGGSAMSIMIEVPLDFIEPRIRRLSASSMSAGDLGSGLSPPNRLELRVGVSDQFAGRGHQSTIPAPPQRPSIPMEISDDLNGGIGVAYWQS